MIRVENYFESPLDMTNGEIQTTKKDKDYHGYGVKSIRYTAEQYGGSVSITAEDNWFYLRILIPISDNQK
jgi:sensor histidine kinase regulating citrate/malate metabolism